MLVCKTAGHDSDHRPGDHGLVVVREPFVVADGTAVFGDPGDGALHHRPSRQPATGPPGSYPDRTHTGRRRRACRWIRYAPPPTGWRTKNRGWKTPGRGRGRGQRGQSCSVLPIPKRSLAEFPRADAFPRSEDPAEVCRVVEAPARPDSSNGSVSQPWVCEVSDRVVESAVADPF